MKNYTCFLGITLKWSVAFICDEKSFNTNSWEVHKRGVLSTSRRRMLQRDEKREEREGWVRVFNSMELLRKGAGWGAVKAL